MRDEPRASIRSPPGAIVIPATLIVIPATLILPVSRLPLPSPILPTESVRKKKHFNNPSLPIGTGGDEGRLLDAAVGRRRFASKVWKPMESRRRRRPPSSGGRGRVSTSSSSSSSSFDLILVSRLDPLLVDTVGVVFLFPVRLGRGRR